MPVIEPITKESLVGEITPRTSSATELLKKLEAEKESKDETPLEAPPSTDSSKAPSEEAKAPDKEITAETSPQDAMRIAAAIRKEKLLRKKEKELSEQKRQLEDREKSYEPWKQAAERAKTNKLEALKLLGISYDDLTQQVLNNGELPPQVQVQQTAEEIVNRKLAEIEKRQAEKEMELQKQNYEQSIKQIDYEVELSAGQGDKYPLVKESGAYHDVTEYIEQEFHRTGKIIPVEAALEQVENQIAEGILHLAKIEKIKSQLLTEPKKEPQQAQPEQKITTLTHKGTVTPPSSRPITDAERRQRAIDAYFGKTVT